MARIAKKASGSKKETRSKKSIPRAVAIQAKGEKKKVAANVSSAHAGLVETVGRTFGFAPAVYQTPPVLPLHTASHPAAQAITALLSATAIEPPQRPAGKLMSEDYELPRQYHHTSITLMARDPYWVHAYWDINPAALAAAQKKIGPAAARSAFVVRMYDVTFVNFDGRNANHWFDIEVSPAALSWNINLWCDNVAYCAEYGLRTPAGTFFPITRSNVVVTPRSSQSPRSDVIWISRKESKRRRSPVIVVDTSTVHGRSIVSAPPLIMPDVPSPQATPFDGQTVSDTAIEIPGMDLPTVPEAQPADVFKPTIGRRYFLTDEDIREYYRRLLPLIRRARRSTRRQRGAALVVYIDRDTQNLPVLPEGRWQVQPGSLMAGSSGGLTPGSSEMVAAGGDRNFFFEIGMELIVYGRTAADASVRLGETPVALRSDGTFSLRYALPDGHIPFDFTATARDGEQSRRITSAVERFKTRHV